MAKCQFENVCISSRNSLARGVSVIIHRQKATSYIPEYGKTKGKRWPFVIAGDVFEGAEDGLFLC